MNKKYTAVLQSCGKIFCLSDKLTSRAKTAGGPSWFVPPLRQLKKIFLLVVAWAGGLGPTMLTCQTKNFKLVQTFGISRCIGNFRTRSGIVLIDWCQAATRLGRTKFFFIAARGRLTVQQTPSVAVCTRVPFQTATARRIPHAPDQKK